MAITGYRPPTSAEVDAYRAANIIGPTVSQATLPNGEVVFYDAGTVAQLYPQYSGMTDDQKRAFLATMPGGVMLRIPLQPILVPDGPNSPTNPISLSLASDVVNLAALVNISKQSIDRTYVKNTMQPIDGDTLVFQNASTTITIDVVLNTTMGMTFYPSVFTLAPSQTLSVAVSFDPTQVNQLPEGISTIASTITLSSQTIIDREIISAVVPEGPPPIIEFTPPSLPIRPDIPQQPVDPWKPVVTTPWIPVTVTPPIIIGSLDGDAPPMPPPPILDTPPIQDIPPVTAPTPFIPVIRTPIVDDPSQPAQPTDGGTIIDTTSSSGGGGGGSDPTVNDGTTQDGTFVSRFLRFFDM